MYRKNTAFRQMLSQYNSESTSWQHFSSDDGLVCSDVRVIAEAPDKSLWFGCSPFTITKFIIQAPPIPVFGTVAAGASRYDPISMTWQNFTTADGLTSDDVNAIAIESNGTLWFGTSSGVSRFVPHR